jgi:anaerobic selenocysteine-containing dehydrogenase
MHPTDAGKRGLVDGQTVSIHNERGTVQTALLVSDIITPGAVTLVGKWWSEPEETAVLANMLTPSSWSAGGQPAYNDTFVEVEAVQ